MTTHTSTAYPRRSGITTMQMLHAPDGAIFVWCASDISYPVKLAKHLGRSDLSIKPLAWLTVGFGENLNGCDGFVMLDHAADVPVRTAYVMTERNRRWEINHGCDASAAAR